MRRPHSRNCCAAFHLEVAHVIPGCTGFFPVQSNTKGMEHYIVQIAHVRKILHVASRFAKLIDGANLVVIDDGVLFCGGHGLRYKASRISRSVFRILSVFAMQCLVDKIRAMVEHSTNQSAQRSGNSVKVPLIEGGWTDVPSLGWKDRIVFPQHQWQ